MISISSSFSIRRSGGRSSAPLDKNVNAQGDQRQRRHDADDHESIVSQKDQHSPAVKHRENSLHVIAERTRDHDRQQELPTRILECSRCSDKDLERQRRWQDRGNSNREKPEPLVSTFDSLDACQRESFAQHGLPAASHDRVEQVATNHRTGGRKKWKVINRAWVSKTTTDDEIVVYLRQ